MVVKYMIKMVWGELWSSSQTIGRLADNHSC
jgi:hypothetical protein